MKQRNWLVIVLSGIITIAVFFSCSKSNGGDTASGPDSAVINIGKNIIIPSYQTLSTAVSAMDAAIIAFNAAPATGTLTSAQNAFKDAYKAWTACSEFEFGPAADQTLMTTTINVFPTDVDLINSNINSGSYTIDGIANFKAQGFPAIDFLLFNTDNNTVLTKFTTDPKAANAKQYLAAVSGSLKTKAATVANAWSSSGGNYINTFINATGVNAGSGLSLLINAYVHDYDVVLKNYKIGIPIGKYGPTVLPIAPAKVEAYYSGMSISLLLLQMQAIQNIYTGGTGYGLDDKVVAANALKNGQPLNDVIKNQVALIITKLQAIPNPLSTVITNNSPAVLDAYNEVQKLVVLLKVDLSSALGVKISFEDDDGD